MRKAGYIRTDLRRIAESKETYIGILGVAASLLFSVSENGMESVAGGFLYATYGVGFLLSFVFCAYSYASVYSEELENGYIRYSVMRGGLKRYTASKTAAIFLSSLIVMGAGCTLFAVVCSFGVPWTDVNSYGIMESGGYACLAERKLYVLWTAAYGLQWGLLAGILSLAAAFASLFISNRLLVLAVPVFLYQVLIELETSLAPQSSLGIQAVFDARYHLFSDDGKMLLGALGCSLILAALIGLASYFRLKRRM